MPIDLKDLPLEVQDHVTLDQPIVIETTWNRSIHLVIPAGTHGVVKATRPGGGSPQVVFGEQLFQFDQPWSDLTLYRRAMNGKRRDDHDKRRPK